MLRTFFDGKAYYRLFAILFLGMVSVIISLCFSDRETRIAVVEVLVLGFVAITGLVFYMEVRKAREKRERFSKLTEIYTNELTIFLENKRVISGKYPLSYYDFRHWVKNDVGRIILQAMFDLALLRLAKYLFRMDMHQRTLRNNVKDMTEQEPESNSRKASNKSKHGQLSIEEVERLSKEEGDCEMKLAEAKGDLNFLRNMIGKLGFRKWENYKFYLLLNEDRIMKEAIRKLKLKERDREEKELLWLT